VRTAQGIERSQLSPRFIVSTRRSNTGTNKKMPGKAKAAEQRMKELDVLSPGSAGMQQKNRPAPLFS
jgi:hypothetical protein